MKRADIKLEDRTVLSLIIALQDNEYNKCFMRQRAMGDMLGMSLKVIGLSIARLAMTDGNRKHKKNPTYAQPLIYKIRTFMRQTYLTTYFADLSKDSPLWWLKEHSEGRAGNKDIRYKNKPKQIAKVAENNVISMKK